MVHITFATLPARADYLSFNGASVAPNIAEIGVGSDGVSIRLEVFVGDIALFSALLPDDWFRDDAIPDETEAERLARFSETGITVRNDDGQAYPVTIRRVEPRMRIDRSSPLAGKRDPLYGKKFPAPPDDKRVVYIELFYPFGPKRPDAITFSPPRNDDGTPTAVVGMVVLDRDVPIASFSFLSGPARLTIDWDDPWYSKFDNPNLTRHHKSGVTTFIYADPREVRHETLIRVRELEAWLELGLSPQAELSPAMQDTIAARALELLASRNQVSIDGQPRQTDARKSEILTLDANGLKIVPDGTTVRADAAFVGVILSFPHETMPQSVVVTWYLFSDRIGSVPATATDPAGPFLSGASPDDPDIVWTNHLRTYQNPAVEPVKAETVGTFTVSLLSVLSVVTVVFAGIVALRRRGTARIAACGAAVAGLAGMVLARDVATIDLPNPLNRVPDVVEATVALETLLGNVNIANLEVTPQARQREMRPLVTTRALADVTVELDRALAVRVPTGGLARVTKISNLSLQEIAPVDKTYGFQGLAEWSAEASAGHWGHSHQRALEYRALVEVIEDDGFWKLDGITVLQVRSPDA